LGRRIESDDQKRGRAGQSEAAPRYMNERVGSKFGPIMVPVIARYFDFDEGGH